MRRLWYWSLVLTSIPVLAIQGWHLRRSAPRFAAAEGERTGIAFAQECGNDGDRQENDRQENELIHLLGLGDSIIAGVGAAQIQDSLTACVANEMAILSKKNIHWAAAGWSGATATELMQHWQQHRAEAKENALQTHIVLISVGVNDVTALHSTQRWRKDLNALLDKVRWIYPEALVCVLGLPDFSCFPLLPFPLNRVLAVRRKIFDQCAREVLSNKPRMIFVANEFKPGKSDFSADGYHPSEASYIVWAQQIVAVLSKCLALDKNTRANV